MRVEILPEVELYRRAAELFLETAQQAIQHSGLFTVALAGGSTPRSLYSLLAQNFADSIDWSKTQLFFTDERCVPPHHPDSNFRMVEETLLSKVPAPAANIHRMKGEDEPAAAARLYEGELRRVFGDSSSKFDLILLGIGEDCHTASIFPGSELLIASGGAVASTYVEQLGAYRLTLTPTVIKSAYRIIVTATGASKAEAVRRAIDLPFEPEKCPAQMLREVSGEVVWLVDNELFIAQRGLNSTPHSPDNRNT